MSVSSDSEISTISSELSLFNRSVSFLFGRFLSRYSDLSSSKDEIITLEDLINEEDNTSEKIKIRKPNLNKSLDTEDSLEVFSKYVPSINIINFTYEFRVLNDPSKLKPRSLKKSFTVFLDFDETLIYCRDGCNLYIRANVRRFLNYLKEETPYVEIIGWSAGDARHVSRALYILDPENEIFTYVICYGKSWLPIKTRPRKLISLIDVNRKRSSVLVDDLLAAGAANGLATIVVYPFDPYHKQATQDTTILYVGHLIKFIADSLTDKGAKFNSVTNKLYKFNSVQEAIQAHPFIKIIDIPDRYIFYKEDYNQTSYIDVLSKEYKEKLKKMLE